MIVAEKIVRYLARLYIKGAQLPDKPIPKKLSRSAKGAKRLRSKNSFGGRLSPSRCGLPAVQDKAARIDITTPQDVAASLCAIKDRNTRTLVEWLATPWWQEHDVRLMISRSIGELHRQFPKIDATVARAIVISALHELKDADSCTACNTNGVIYDQNAKKWAPCPHCNGTGQLGYGYRRRTTSMKTCGVTITEHQYRTYLSEPYQWLVNRLQQRVVDAWSQIRSER